jgi:hypothetical protein
VATTASGLDTGTRIFWTIPKEIAERTDINRVRIHRSSSENGSYTQIDEVAAGAAPNIVTTYFDASSVAVAGGGRGFFYLVTFVSTTTPFESCFHTTFFEPNPKERRLIEQVKRTIPAVMQDSLTDEDYLNGLNIAVQIFNSYPPATSFTLANFPSSHEFFLTALAQLTALSSRYLTISIRDFRYSEPGGVVMDIDRGAKINEAMNIVTRVFTQLLPLLKLDFSEGSPEGLGTIQLPLSMGGVVSRGLLNVLDIFTAVGR